MNIDEILMRIINPTTTFSHRSNKAPTPPASRPPYAQKLTAAAQYQKPEPAQVEVVSPVSKTSPLFLQTSVQDPAGFTPLLTPNSDALLQKKLSEVVYQPPQRAVGINYPAFPQQTNLDRFQENQRYDNFVEYRQPAPLHTDGYYQTTSLTNAYDYQESQDNFPLLLDTFKPIPAPKVLPYCDPVPVSVPAILTSTEKFPRKIQPSAPVKIQRLSDQEFDTQTEKIAYDVVSNLFSNKKEILDHAAKVNAPKKPVARNLFCHDAESLAKARNFEPSDMSVLDDWETADDEDLTVRMENLLKDKKKEEETKKPSASKAPPPPRASDWDPMFLPHVLEIYGVPDYKMQGDVVKAMETSGNGDCKVMWMERKVVFAVFENVARAKNCLAVSKHDWLRFRSLADSPKNVQDSAKANASSLGIPKKSNKRRQQLRVEWSRMHLARKHQCRPKNVKRSGSNSLRLKPPKRTLSNGTESSHLHLLS
uniref:RRM domain-containing protein n=1 Tax=Caenorhabditis tropicalis TaxID=1561998 RepID=A0A1I7TZJ4_9PELO